VRRLLHDESGEGDGVGDGGESGDRAAVQGGSLHDAGLHLDGAGGGEHGAPAGVEVRAVLQLPHLAMDGWDQRSTGAAGSGQMDRRRDERTRGEERRRRTTSSTTSSAVRPSRSAAVPMSRQRRSVARRGSLLSGGSVRGTSPAPPCRASAHPMDRRRANGDDGERHGRARTPLQCCLLSQRPTHSRGLFAVMDMGWHRSP
jgi:hypothetical protein